MTARTMISLRMSRDLATDMRRRAKHNGLILSEYVRRLVEAERMRPIESRPPWALEQTIFEAIASCETCGKVHECREVQGQDVKSRMVSWADPVDGHAYKTRNLLGAQSLIEIANSASIALRSLQAARGVDG